MTMFPADLHADAERPTDPLSTELWLSVRKQLGLANDQSSSMWHLPWENTDASNTAYCRAHAYWRGHRVLCEEEERVHAEFLTLLETEIAAEYEVHWSS